METLAFTIKLIFYFVFSYELVNTNSETNEQNDQNQNEPACSPIYDDIKSTPKNFSLSNYGHLKIDYSYSWNNLNRYICK